MRRVYTLFFICCLAATGWSQTQQGVVKTRGRMVNGKLQPGKGLPGATVQVKDRSAVVSGTNGKFSFPLRTNTYVLQSVKKQGYQLVDMEACRNYKYSQEPLYLVMETPEQQRSDLLAAERKIRRNLQQQLQQKEDEIEALNVSLEEKEKRLQRLYQQQTANERLISDMAKRYSTIDYDQMDEFYRQVSYLIEQGELTRADSLLNTKGDINMDVADWQRLKQGNEKEQEELTARNKKLEKSLAYQHWKRNDIAQRAYSKYEIFKLAGLSDSAAYYIDLRAQLDTTNSIWQYQAGEYFLFYKADLELALTYLQRGLNQAMLQPESNSYVDLCYLCIGYYHQEKEHFKQAEEYYQKALEYDKTRPANDNSRISQVLLYFSGLYYRMGDYAKALENAQRIIDLNDTINHDNRGFVRYAYGQIAQTYSEQGKYEDALKYFQLAMEATELSSDNKRETALLFSNYGVLLRRLNKNDQAVEMLQKALEIDLQLYGKNHPTVGRAYGNIANIYMSKGEYATAKEYMQKSLDILSRVYGTNNMNIASLYGNMGALSAHQEKWNETLSYYTKAMDISERLLGSSHPQTALMYHGVGMAYVKLGETAKGLGYMEKALTIAKEKLGENHPYVKEMMKDRENIKE